MVWKKEAPAVPGGRSGGVVVLNVFIRDRAMVEKTTPHRAVFQYFVTALLYTAPMRMSI